MASSGTHQDITIIPLTRESCCGYCFAKPDEMKDPLALPCGHPQCEECIELDLAINFDAQCKVCNVTHSEFEVESLARLSKNEVAEVVSAIRKEQNQSLPLPKCDVCKQHPQTAKVWCKDCKKFICGNHLEGHNEYTENHALIPIQDYQKAPARYEVRFCETHCRQVLKEVCRNCEKLFCDRCTTREVCLVNKGQHHNITDLKDFSDEKREDLAELTERTAYLIERFHKQDKKAWKSVSHMEDQLNNSLKEIEKAKQMKMRQIEDEAEGAKSDLRNHLAKVTAAVETYSEDLTTKITLLEDLVMEGESLATKSHEIDVLQRFQGLSMKFFEEAASESKQLPFVPEHRYISAGASSSECKSFDLQISSIPSQLTYVGSVVTTDVCGDVSWKDESTIACCMKDGVELRDLNMVLKKSINIPGLVYNIRYFQNGEDFNFRVYRDGKYLSFKVMIPALTDFDILYTVGKQLSY